MLYGVTSPVRRGWVGFGTGAGRKQSFFYATPARRVLEKVPGTSLAHARRPFGKPPTPAGMLYAPDAGGRVSEDALGCAWADWSAALIINANQILQSGT
jgi:hypothetical protein